MTENRLTHIIDELSEAFILIDPDDPVELETLKAFIQDIHDLSVQCNLTDLTNKTLESLDTINSIIEGDTGDIESFLNKIGADISGFQELDRVSKLVSNGIPDIDAQKNTAEPSRKKSNNRVKNKRLIHPGTLPTHLDDEVYGEFLSLQPEILQRMEALVLELETDISDEKVNELKRLIHTMKGEAGFLNLDDTEQLCHKTEDIIEAGYSSDYTDLFFAVIDWLKHSFGYYSGIEENALPIAPVFKKISSITVTNDGVSLGKQDYIGEIENEIKRRLSDEIFKMSEEPSLIKKFINQFKSNVPNINSFLLSLSAASDDEYAILKLNSIFSSIIAVSSFLELTEISFLSTEIQRLLNSFRQKSVHSCQVKIHTIFESIETLDLLYSHLENAILKNQTPIHEPTLGKCIYKIRAVVEGHAIEHTISDDAESNKKIGDILIEKGVANEATIEKCVVRQAESTPGTLIGEMLIREEKIPAVEVANALQTQTDLKKKSAAVVREAINVDTEKLDKIINMIGELAIAESMIISSEEIREMASSDLNRNIFQMDKIIRELHKLGLSLRMIPIRPVFQKMGRVVRDIAKKSNKLVQFKTEGDDTELDKTIVDKLKDPLMHIVRNAVDHGIEETVKERREAGKPDSGSVYIQAFHKGGNIYIEIKDDGKGLNKKKILQKGIDIGIAVEGEIKDDSDIYNLILEPGFSTADKVTDISGRGVGMNVVKDSIDTLRGQVEIRSEEGAGCTFSLRIPLTMAIIDGMVIRVDNERYIIPTLSIVTSARISADKITSVINKGNMIQIQDKLVPLFDLHRLFSENGVKFQKKTCLVVVIEDNNHQTAILVDELIGKQQIVIKSLGKRLQNIRGISGGAIMHDSQVGLILDVNELVRMAHQK